MGGTSRKREEGQNAALLSGIRARPKHNTPLYTAHWTDTTRYHLPSTFFEPQLLLGPLFQPQIKTFSAGLPPSARRSPPPPPPPSPHMASFYKNLREQLTPTLKQSAFLDRGVLTPEEFVKAGDNLVFKCPTWCWEGGSPSLQRSHLPPNKQFLITRNVPCAIRATAIEAAAASSSSQCVIDEDGWTLDGSASVGSQPQPGTTAKAAAAPPPQRSAADDDDFDDLTADGMGVGGGAAPSETVPAAAVPATKAAVKAPAAPAFSGGDDEYADIDDEDLVGSSGLVSDAAALSFSPAPPGVQTSSSSSAQSSSSSGAGAGAGARPSSSSNVLHVRTYDVSISYDKYYQTPRVWLSGYSPSNCPLSGDEIFEDVMSDYARRTVTLEAHPHRKGATATVSIHPCKHGDVMKNIVDNMGGRVDIESYMFIFLKFVSSIVPTVNYDFTMGVKADMTSGKGGKKK